MGFSVTFAAVPLDRKNAVLEAAGVHVTDHPDPDGAGLLSAAEYKDHFLLWRNLRAASLFTEPDWAGLSVAAPMTVLDVVDSAGAQVLRGFDHGEVIWEVSFQDTNDPILKVTRRVPVDTEALRSKLRDRWLEQHPEDAGESDEDLVAGYGMDLPSLVFEALTDHYYEDGPPVGLHALSGDLPQVKLTWSGERKDPSSKPWWRIW